MAPKLKKYSKPIYFLLHESSITHLTYDFFIGWNAFPFANAASGAVGAPAAPGAKGEKEKLGPDDFWARIQESVTHSENMGRSRKVDVQCQSIHGGS